MIVMSLYNIVDQIFIGQTVGELGNAATNVAFPLTTLCLATALTLGIGSASGFNLNMGAGDTKKAPYYIGNATTLMLIIGVIIGVIGIVFMKPMLLFFGSTDKVLPFAMEYTRVIALGFPAAIVSAGGAHLVRADGNPNFSMACNLTGAVINVVLDYIFVILFGWGMSGAAIATIIGQYVATLMVIWYLIHFKTVKLKKEHFKSKSPWYGSRIKSVGNYVCSDCNEQDTNILRGVKFIRSKYTPCSMRNCNEGKSGLLLSLYWGSPGHAANCKF